MVDTERKIENDFGTIYVDKEFKGVFTGLRHYKYSPDRVNIQVINIGKNMALKHPSKGKEIRVVNSCMIDKKTLKKYIADLQFLLRNWEN